LRLVDTSFPVLGHESGGAADERAAAFRQAGAGQQRLARPAGRARAGRHRHTLRYRIRKVEAITGRDLSGATDRIEFWLALRARDLTADSTPRAPGR
jgi:PucR C-terminal helix-turn-helix domain